MLYLMCSMRRWLHYPEKPPKSKNGDNHHEELPRPHGWMMIMIHTQSSDQMTTRNHNKNVDDITFVGAL